MKLKLWLFLKLTRPLFLAGGILLFLLGAVIAWREGAPSRAFSYLIGQLLITSVQLMTHYANEYYDQESDRLNEQRTWFSGGSGALIGKGLSPAIARYAAWVCGGLGLAWLALAAMQTPILLPLGMTALLASWFYSAPPLALSGSGWGEVSASLVVAGLVPLFGYTIQSGGRVSHTILWVGLSLALLHLAMLIAFSFPDYPADRLAGKRTLAVRLGLRSAARLHNLALLGAEALLLALALTDSPGARFTPLVLPLALWQAHAIHWPLAVQPRRLALTLGALALFAVTVLLWLAGFALT